MESRKKGAKLSYRAVFALLGAAAATLAGLPGCSPLTPSLPKTGGNSLSNSPVDGDGLGAGIRLDELDTGVVDSGTLRTLLDENQNSSVAISLSNTELTHFKSEGRTGIQIRSLPSREALVLVEVDLDPVSIEKNGISVIRTDLTADSKSDGIWNLALIDTADSRDAFSRAREKLINVHILFFLNPESFEFQGINPPKTQSEGGDQQTAPVVVAETSDQPAVAEPVTDATDSVPGSDDLSEAEPGEPTPEPSVEPSASPSPEPTAEPSPEPSGAEPSPAPEVSPSPEPSPSPSPSPSPADTYDEAEF